MLPLGLGRISAGLSSSCLRKFSNHGGRRWLGCRRFYQGNVPHILQTSQNLDQVKTQIRNNAAACMCIIER